MLTPKVSTDAVAIQHFLTRGVENVYPNREAVEKALLSGKRLRVYLGVDPTGPSLHLGHAIVIRKLAELQKLGHEVILLIGDFTAMIGDPTDKTATRKRLTRQAVLANCKGYKEQASRILSFTGKNPATLKYNSTWLRKMSFEDILKLSAHFTVQQILERDMFEQRMESKWEVQCQRCKQNVVLSGALIRVSEEGSQLPSISISYHYSQDGSFCPGYLIPEKEFHDYARVIQPSRPIYLHEFLYPLMQAYDSVAMDVDMEVGGNDQTFNMLAGRTLIKAVKGKEKFVLTTRLLVDPSGKKMGKTEGIMIALTDAPEDMYGKVMSWTDGMIMPGFELCTEVSDKEISDMRSRMADGENPMPFKRRLAREVVRMFAGEKAATAADAHFSKVHQAHEAPSDVPTFKVRGSSSLVDVLVGSGLVASKSEARRQIEQGGVKVDGRIVSDVAATVKVGEIIQKGKRYFVKLV